MFFFLRSEFDINKLPEDKILLFLLFIFFPLAALALNENEIDETFWNDEESPSSTCHPLTMKGCVTMPLPQQNKEYTIVDIYALSDGQRAELIDGQMRR